MRILKVIARLLDYPSPELFNAAPDLIQVVNEDSYITIDTKNRLVNFINQLTSRDIFDAQETYDLLFDRGRSLSLLLFEHVHGESRDRGQAMVNLLDVYRGKGFEVESSQLPDYIPLYLEFLSEQKNDFAQQWLGDICHLLAMLSERLIKRKNGYAILFNSLVQSCQDYPLTGLK
ncbi:MAG: nitrate reductase molybdenum cofactor assembly chaperone [Enterobacterales bacterium]|nr:nitrate reductase molybdenum cofactor assembly chaperone [Enterobacterales bacterium]